MRKVKYPEIGKRIKQLRLDKHLKQKDCLEPLGDITVQMLSDWENGYVFPSLTYLEKISKFYNTSLDYIIFGKTNQVPDYKISLYSDVGTYIVEMLKSKLFSLRTPFDPELDSGEVILTSYDDSIYKFSSELSKLLDASDVLKPELFDQAIKELLDKYFFPIN